ncbi:hypothetical protein V6N13_041683 [Hibiscus sabdariffa]
MAVDTRRRKPRMEIGSKKTSTVPASNVRGSRFDVLDGVEDEQNPKGDVPLPLEHPDDRQMEMSVNKAQPRAVKTTRPIHLNVAYLTSQWFLWSLVKRKRF